MNMNFIAFSSQAKLLDRPHLDADAAGIRSSRHLDGLVWIPGLDQQEAAQLFLGLAEGGRRWWTALLDAGVRLLLGHRVHVVLDKIYQADVLHHHRVAGSIGNH